MKVLKSIGTQLSRYEQKSIIGGSVQCTANVYDSGGNNYYSFSGSCASSSTDECTQYAGDACKAFASSAGSGYSCGSVSCNQQ